MNILTRIRRATAELRGATLRDPPDWLTEAVTGGKVAAGVAVTESTAMTFSAVYACVRIIAESIASLPLHVYERQEPRGKRIRRDHPAHRLLHDEANPVSTAVVTRETMAAHVLQWGNAYAEIERTNAGAPLAVWPIEPPRVQVVVESPTRVAYELDGGPRKIAAENMIHVPGLSRNGVVGLSPIRLHREAIGVGLAAERVAGTLFGNDSRPAGILRHPGKLKKDALENIRESWERIHKGPSLSNRTAVLAEDMKYERIGIPPEDAQLLESRKFSVLEVARIYRVPPHLLADLDRATFSNIDSQGIAFVVHTLRPWLVRFEQEFARKLLRPVERERLAILHNVDGLLRGDVAARTAAYVAGRQWGWLSADDVREMEDKNPLPDGEGDVYHVPLNMIPAGSEAGSVGRATDGAADGPPAEDELEDDEDAGGEAAGRSRADELERRAAKQAAEERSIAARNRIAATHSRLFEDSAARVVSREGIAVGRAARKLAAGGTVSAFLKWVEDYYERLEPTVREALGAAVEVYGTEIERVVSEEIDDQAGSTGRSEAFAAFLGAYGAAMAARYIGSSRGQLQKLAADVSLDDLADAIRARAAEWREQRPALLARREAAQLGNAVSRHVYDRAGRGARWVTVGKNCPRCQAMDGRIVGGGGSFGEQGDRIGPDEAPIQLGRTLRHPPLHDGCNCQIVAE